MNGANEMEDQRKQTSSAVVPRKLRCLAVGSGKGGVGKTMISVGLATSLASKGYKVLLFDADLGLANVDLQIGVDPVFTLQDVLYGDCSLERAVISVPGGPDVLAAASGIQEMVTMSAGRRDLLVDQLISFSARYDYLIVDTEAGIGPGAVAFLRSMPQVFVVVANEPTSVMDAYSLIKILKNGCGGPVPEIQLIVNMVRSLGEGRQLAERLNQTVERFLNARLNLAGIVLHDYVVGDAIRARQSVLKFAPNSAPARCLSELATFVSGANRLREGARGIQRDSFESLLGLGSESESKERSL